MQLTEASVPQQSTRLSHVLTPLLGITQVARFLTVHLHVPTSSTVSLPGPVGTESVHILTGSFSGGGGSDGGGGDGGGGDQGGARTVLDRVAGVVGGTFTGTVLADKTFSWTTLGGAVLCTVVHNVGKLDVVVAESGCSTDDILESGVYCLHGYLTVS